MEAAATIVVDGDKLLILKRSKKANRWKGYWNFSGGGHEFNESLDETAVRELKEEADLNVDPKDLQYLGYIQKGNLRIHFYITRTFSGEVKINDESDKFVWCPVDEINNYLFIGGELNQELLRKIKKYMER